MANIEHMEVTRHIPLDSLESILETLDDMDLTSKQREKIKDRLSFIRLRYKGYSIAEAADIMSINRQSAYNWQTLWNESDGDILKLCPNFTGGPKHRLSKETLVAICNYVAPREMCTAEVCDYIQMAYGVKYTPMHVSRIMREGGLKYCRGYKVDYRRPSNGEEILKKTSDWHWTR